MIHDYDVVTQFCKRCGMNEMPQHSEPCCADATNIVAVSHILAWRRFAETDPELFRACVLEIPHQVPMLAAKDLKAW